MGVQVGGVGVMVCPPGTELDTSLMSLWGRVGLVCWCGGQRELGQTGLAVGWKCGIAALSLDVKSEEATHSDSLKHGYTHSCACLPDQRLIVKGLGWLPSQDIDLTLVDRELYFALHILLGFVNAVSHKITLWTVPETWSEKGKHNTITFSDTDTQSCCIRIINMVAKLALGRLYSRYMNWNCWYSFFLS